MDTPSTHLTELYTQNSKLVGRGSTAVSSHAAKSSYGKLGVIKIITAQLFKICVKVAANLPWDTKQLLRGTKFGFVNENVWNCNFLVKSTHFYLFLFLIQFYLVQRATLAWLSPLPPAHCGAKLNCLFKHL